MKTLKQIADENGLDKQAVYRFVKKAGIESEKPAEVHHTKNNRLPAHYNDVAERQITEHFKEKTTSNDVHQSTSGVHQAYISEVAFSTVIETLKMELEAKNRQIESLTAALNTAHQTAAAAQALHAGTMTQNLTGGTVEAGEAEPSRGLWSRIFGKGSKQA